MPSLFIRHWEFILPLITTNCAVLGCTFTNVQKDYNILAGTVNGFATASDFPFLLSLMAGIREKIAYVTIFVGGFWDFEYSYSRIDGHCNLC